MCYILCMCVCGHVRYDNCVDDPSSSALCVMCIQRFPRGVPGGVGMPPLVTHNVRQRAVAQGNAPKFFLGGFCYF
jgi:hypothetical protein